MHQTEEEAPPLATAPATVAPIAHGDDGSGERMKGIQSNGERAVSRNDQGVGQCGHPPAVTYTRGELGGSGKNKLQ